MVQISIEKSHIKEKKWKSSKLRLYSLFFKYTSKRKSEFYLSSCGFEIWIFRSNSVFGYFCGRKQAKKDLSSGKNFLLFNNCCVFKWVGNSGIGDKIKYVILSVLKYVSTMLFKQEVCGWRWVLGIWLLFLWEGSLKLEVTMISIQGCSSI